MPARQLDLGELTARVSGVAGARRPGVSIGQLRALTGGSSGLTYAATLAGGSAGKQDVVIKVAPPGVPPTLNRDVLRQARLLRSIGDAPGVQVPEVLFEDPGDPPDVPPFFVMTHVWGDSFEPINDDEALMPSPAEVGARAHHAARMLAALHGVDPGAGVAVPDLGWFKASRGTSRRPRWG
jgi:aminoglycoside phosphotransferase (APT) family kinase protein